MFPAITKINPLYIALISLVVGIALIFISGNKAPTPQEEKNSIEHFDEELYEENLEKRLKSIVEKVDGVGEVSVMLTLDGSAIYTYATDTSQDTKADGDNKRESNVVLSVNGSNQKDAIISGYLLPDIKGAAIVCSNPITPTLQGRVIGVVSAALGISTSKIYVTN